MPDMSQLETPYPSADDVAALCKTLSRSETHLAALPNLEPDVRMMEAAAAALLDAGASIEALVAQQSQLADDSHRALSAIRSRIAATYKSCEMIQALATNIVRQTDCLADAAGLFERSLGHARTSLYWTLGFIRPLADACDEIARDPSQVEAIVARLASQPGMVGLHTAAFLRPAADRDPEGAAAPLQG